MHCWSVFAYLDFQHDRSPETERLLWSPDSMFDNNFLKSEELSVSFGLAIGIATIGGSRKVVLDAVGTGEACSQRSVSKF